MFTSFHQVYLVIQQTQKRHHELQIRSSSASWISRDGSSSLSPLVTREPALLAMETKLNLGEDSGQGFTQIIPYPAAVTLPKLGNFTRAW